MASILRAINFSRTSVTFRMEPVADRLSLPDERDGKYAANADWARAGAISPLDDKLGVRITDYDPDRMVATMPVDGNSAW